VEDSTVTDTVHTGTVQTGTVQTKPAPARAGLFTFPNPVNEYAARTVAGGVLVLSIVTLVLSLAVDHRWLWLSAALAYGFLARVLTGPTLSPLGQLASRVVGPRIGSKPVAGPPKRFAQAIGAVVTVSAFIATATGAFGLAQVLLGLIIVAASLESIGGYCIGCRIFAILMRLGVIPQETCEACANVGLRYRT
jgi:hypothetical protein